MPNVEYIESWLEDQQAHYTFIDHIDLFFHRRWSQIQDIKFNIKVWFQRAFRGYSCLDVFDYYTQNSKMAIKCLTTMKEDKQGYPCMMFEDDCELDDTGNPTKLECEKASVRWQEILNSIIFFHTVCSGVDRPKDNLYILDPPVISKLTGKLSKPIYWWDPNYLYPYEKEQFERGRSYYSTYYECLWS